MLSAHGLLPSLLLSWTPGQEEESAAAACSLVFAPEPRDPLKRPRSQQELGQGAHTLWPLCRVQVPLSPAGVRQGSGARHSKGPPPHWPGASGGAGRQRGAGGAAGAAVGKRKLAVSQVLSLNE